MWLEKKSAVIAAALAVCASVVTMAPLRVEAAESPLSSMQDPSIRMPTYAEVVDDLHQASIPVRELAGSGSVAITLAAGRVVAMAFSKDSPNLMWSHPQLNDAALVKNHPEKLVGGFGGDRLWFSPELDYHWRGAPDWKEFSNYQAPAATDPGAYQFIGASKDSVELRAQGKLTAYGQTQPVGFEVRRGIRMTPSPISRTDPLMQGVDYVGIETSNTLKLDPAAKTGRMDLWHLLQMPVGSVLIVPLKSTAGEKDKTPLSYGLPGAWIRKRDHIHWRYGGEAHAKFGLSAAALTGRTAVLRKLDAMRWCMIVRQFTADPNAEYGDHPYNTPRKDQVFQAWDGYGFGEMEYHSPVLDAQHGARELKETDRLWAFGGSPQSIAKIAVRLLGVDVSAVFRE